MGLLNEVNKISQNQEVILSEKNQKKKLKQQKEYLEYLTQKCKNDILENINKYSKEQIIDTCIEEYRTKLNQVNYFDNTLKLKKYYEMMDFLEKSIKKQNDLDFEQYQLMIIKLFEQSYKKYDKNAYYKLEEGKNEILEILNQENNYKAYNFYDTQNKRFLSKYKQFKQENNYSFLKSALIGSSLGLMAGWKKISK